MPEKHKKKKILLLSLLLVAVAFVVKDSPLIHSAKSTGTPVEMRELWFPVGEKLTYKLYWGFIPVGEMVLETSWNEDGRKKLLSLQGTAKTTSVVSKIYPVNDFVESLVEPKTFLPVKYTQILKEGRHRRYDQTVFDHKKGVAYWTSLRTGEKKTIPIKSDTRDVLCLTYAMRREGIVPKQTKKFKVQVEDKMYNLDITGINIESVEVMDKKVDCIRVKPEASFGEIFQKKGRLYLWFSRDARRLCTKMRVKVFTLAKFKSVLIKVEGPGDDHWVAGQDESKK